MSYQVLARRWRPKIFAELIGQEHVVRALSNGLTMGRVHHAFLFTGTRGVGKTTIARIFAKSLNCLTGVSAEPCGACAHCVDIDAGRFVDLLEIDAASRTKVDDTREILDNVQYSPARGRFKVYLIDEVHMLSTSSFNALLKTLEEPPPHVKFLLATTDPQKLPITVLSRCLQFNLKRLSVEQISVQIERILKTESIDADAESVRMIAEGADGSMRDGLSLLDQALAFGAGALRADDVASMLGTVDRRRIDALLEALAAGDAQRTLTLARESLDLGADAGRVLDDLAGALHTLALEQLVPALQTPRAVPLVLPPEATQLYFQIASGGRQELKVAASPRAGLEMLLLRMLCFRPLGGAAAEPVRPPLASAMPIAVTASAAPTQAFVWETFVASDALSGPARILAQNSVLAAPIVDGQVALKLDPAHAYLRNELVTERLRDALERALGQPVTLKLDIQTLSETTPARQRESDRQDELERAEAALDRDPVVQALKDTLGARLLRDTLRPH
jgi:DNA polymerase III subunit gamma/tau